MEERVLISLLLDFYGPLLTDKQRMSLQLHHEDDMSLGEIAEELGVSRQAVHDNLQRARHILNDYESKLHLVAQYEAREQVINELKDTLPAEVLSQSRVQQLLTQMEG
ncbi:MAG: putative DNA-binding protein [Veillonella sp.]|uniref:YlxM family DNA-binding protein n=1 Tax=Veillonella sp. TaxID=1926307 RepID=UPI00290A5371|nr:putative DNA-binding protein [Veillonella sp.]MDU5731954.1 putative DNA-binding protein [Veillonella sp.]